MQMQLEIKNMEIQNLK